jgi:hypothetical protein
MTAYPSTVWTEITSTTLANYRETLADNVLKHNALLTRLQEKGNVDEAEGGYVLLENLMYEENGTFSWYAGYQVLNVSASDVVTSAQFDWKQANCNVSISGREQMQNSGREAKFDLVKSRILVAEKTMKNNISKSLFYSNTEAGGLAIGGLQFLVADSPITGTVGGIDSAAQTWWQSQYTSVAGLGAGAASATTIQGAMDTMYLKTLRGRDEVDLILAGNTYFKYYWNSLQTNQRFVKSDEARAGFPGGIQFMNADVLYDPGETSGTRMYFLNTDYFHFRPHKDRNFITDPEKASVNQDALVVPVYWGGNLTCSNRSLQGVIIA